jgi:hypothetical protein
MKRYFSIQPNLVFISSVKMNVKLTCLQSDYMGEQGSGDDVTDEGVKITSPTIKEQQDLPTSNHSLINKKTLMFVSLVGGGFLFYMGFGDLLKEKIKIFCYPGLKTVSSSISGSEILKENVNRVSGLHFFFKKLNLPKEVYIPCLFLSVAGLVLIGGGLSTQEQDQMQKVWKSESLVDHCSPEELKTLQKLCSTIKSVEDFNGSVCQFLVELKSAEIKKKGELKFDGEKLFPLALWHFFWHLYKPRV